MRGNMHDFSNEQRVSRPWLRAWHDLGEEGFLPQVCQRRRPQRGNKPVVKLFELLQILLEVQGN